MPRRLTHDTGYWERGGATAFGKAAAASRLWLADAIVSNQTEPCMAQARQALSWEPDCGSQRIAIAFGRKGEAAGVQGTEGNKPLILRLAPCPLINPSLGRSSTGTRESLPPST